MQKMKFIYREKKIRKHLMQIPKHALYRVLSLQHPENCKEVFVLRVDMLSKLIYEHVKYHP